MRNTELGDINLKLRDVNLQDVNSELRDVNAKLINDENWLTVCYITLCSKTVYLTSTFMVNSC